MNPARRTLDPRAKLYLLLVANLMLFFHVGLATQIVMVVLFLLPLLAAARWRTALNFGVTYAVLTALGMLDPDALGLPWLHVVSALAVGVTMMLPLFHHRRVYVHHHVRERVHLRDAAYARA